MAGENLRLVFSLSLFSILTPFDSLLALSFSLFCLSLWLSVLPTFSSLYDWLAFKLMFWL